MGLIVGQTYWFSAAVAIVGILHMVVVKKDLFPRLRIPLDGGRTLGGKPIFGDNKTWRGGGFMGGAFGPWALRAEAAPLDYAAVGRFLGDGRLAFAGGYAAVAALMGFGYA